jgi:hypothetical protein
LTWDNTMMKKQNPIVGSSSDNRGIRKTYSWENSNAKLVISQGITWLLLNVCYLPWVIVFGFLVMEAI